MFIETWTNNICKYFDTFGLIMPNEILRYLQTSNDKIIYSTDENTRDEILFYVVIGVLYYLLERQKGKPILDINT